MARQKLKITKPNIEIEKVNLKIETATILSNIKYNGKFYEKGSICPIEDIKDFETNGWLEVK